MNKLIFFALLIILQGCASMPNGLGHTLRSSAIEEYAQAHPDRADQVGAIKEQKVMIGMTEEEAYLSWGKPPRKNRTTTSSGLSEQWVYGRNYLYFNNGKLTAIQN